MRNQMTSGDAEQATLAPGGSMAGKAGSFFRCVFAAFFSHGPAEPACSRRRCVRRYLDTFSTAC